MIFWERVRLRGIEREDIPTFLRWFNDPEVRQYLLMKKPGLKKKARGGPCIFMKAVFMTPIIWVFCRKSLLVKKLEKTGLESVETISCLYVQWAMGKALSKRLDL
jgi:hypothetical protein